MSIRTARRDRTVRVRTLSRSAGCGKYVDETRAYEKSVPYARQWLLSGFASRNIGVVVVTRIITRVTWAAVTSGTPSWSTLAVTHISAMPPGAVASTIVEIGTVLASARPHAKRAETKTARTTEAHTMTTKRGAVLSDFRSNPDPSAHPSRSCAELDSHTGIADNPTSARVSATATASGPSIQAFGRLSFASSAPAVAASTSMASSPEASTPSCPGRQSSTPCTPSKVNRNGTTTSKTSAPRDGASLTRSGRAPKRSPKIVIHGAPPGTGEKSPVAPSSPVLRVRTHPLAYASRSAKTAAAINRYQCTTTSWPTTGVKYKPSAQPMMSCPVARPPLGEARSAPRNFPKAMASKGPSIHGRGARRTLKRTPPAPQIASAFKTDFIFRRKSARRFDPAGHPPKTPL